jgi:hypothetical protein
VVAAESAPAAERRTERDQDRAPRPPREPRNDERREDRRQDRREGDRREGRRPNRDDRDPPVVGMGDHVPDFLMRGLARVETPQGE